ncbi:alpha/beta hydrolase [Actinorhabdospora filicis]|uniref:Alpha/beta hydrolase n=1 Tax=Actinorhabdospora filicis TaxID=1785913 RepID=A0A9W6SG77_9ACTN|nr:alpha/beta hydrolase [Actinorhabdospora filicis]GLZ75432.1 alpha/beta hydrolase [Actinorhabdospora filicis]
MSPTVALAGIALNALSRLHRGLAGRVAYDLFRLSGPRAAIREGEAEVLATAVTGELDLDGVPVRTYRWGASGTPVLFVHGWRSRGSRAAHYVPELVARGHTVLTFDAPGHGASGGRSMTILQYREIITRLHAAHGDFAAVIAHSFGVTASLFALRDLPPARFAGISGIGEFGYLLQAFGAGLRLRPAVLEALRERIETHLFPAEPDIWRRFSVTHRPHELDLPALLVHDGDDAFVPVTQSHRVRDALGAGLITTTGLGHNRIVADPGVVRAVLDFVSPVQADSTRAIARSARS